GMVVFSWRPCLDGTQLLVAQSDQTSRCPLFSAVEERKYPPQKQQTLYRRCWQSLAKHAAQEERCSAFAEKSTAGVTLPTRRAGRRPKVAAWWVEPAAGSATRSVSPCETALPSSCRREGYWSRSPRSP